MDQVLAQGYITHFDWGCDDGVHCSWAIIEAESHPMALMSVPPLLRDNARAVRLVKYSREGMEAIHGME